MASQSPGAIGADVRVGIAQSELQIVDDGSLVGSVGHHVDCGGALFVIGGVAQHIAQDGLIGLRQVEEFELNLAR